MKIVCLGWGSLIWDKGKLQVEDEWRKDGPELPVEFARQSNNGRLTLVITENVKPVQVLWAEMTTTDIEIGKESLRVREGSIRRSDVGVMLTSQNQVDPIQAAIKTWAETKGIDAVVYTNLRPKFNNVDNKAPSVDEAVNYLKSLDGEKLQLAKEYIEKAPAQIITAYRKVFEKELGWYPK